MRPKHYTPIIAGRAYAICLDSHLYFLAAGYGFVQVLFLLCTYAYVLSWSSNLISDGSELLLLVPSLRGIVGSVVLPVLGAVPDGAIVLFSGMGPRDQVEQQVAVGIGALAGSTIMLLTIPWCLSIFAGRVDLGPDGTPNYRKACRFRRRTHVNICSAAAQRVQAVAQGPRRAADHGRHVLQRDRQHRLHHARHGAGVCCGRAGGTHSRRHTW